MEVKESMLSLFAERSDKICYTFVSNFMVSHRDPNTVHRTREIISHTTVLYLLLEEIMVRLALEASNAVFA